LFCVVFKTKGNEKCFEAQSKLKKNLIFVHNYEKVRISKSQ